MNKSTKKWKDHQWINKRTTEWWNNWVNKWNMNNYFVEGSNKMSLQKTQCPAAVKLLQNLSCWNLKNLQNISSEQKKIFANLLLK